LKPSLKTGSARFRNGLLNRYPALVCQPSFTGFSDAGQSLSQTVGRALNQVEITAGYLQAFSEI